MRIRTETTHTATEVRLSEVPHNGRKTSWLLAIFDDEIDAIQAATHALEKSAEHGGAKFAHIKTTRTITKL